VGLAASVLVYVGAMSRHPQGDIGRAVPFVLAAVLVWAVVVGVGFGWRRGVVLALLGGAVSLLAVGLYIPFVLPIGYAECGSIVQERSNEECLRHSDLVWALLCIVGAVGCGAVGIIVTSLTRS
jgi:hypothetical protein